MINFREARQRLSMYNMHIGREGAGTDYRVSFAELSRDKAEASAYYTDDLEDAVITGAAMRRRKNDKDFLQSGRKLCA